LHCAYNCDAWLKRALTSDNKKCTQHWEEKVKNKKQMQKRAAFVCVYNGIMSLELRAEAAEIKIKARKSKQTGLKQREMGKRTGRVQCHRQNGDKMKEKQWQQHRVVVMHKKIQNTALPNAKADL